MLNGYSALFELQNLGILKDIKNFFEHPFGLGEKDKNTVRTGTE